MKITDDMLRQAQAIDMVSYLESRGYTLHQTGSSYKIKVTDKHTGDLSSLSVFSDRKGWKRWSDGTMGHDTISFIQKVFGKTFQEAVCELCGVMPQSVAAVGSGYQKKEERRQFTLPRATAGKYSRAYAYLTNT